MRRFIIMALAGTIIIAANAAPAFAAGHAKQTLCEKAYNMRVAVIKKLDKDAPGRNICRFGIVSRFNNKWTKPATTAEKAMYVRNLSRLAHPPQYMTAAGPPSLAPAGTMSPRASLPWCTWGPESGGDYSASNGTHFGKYQFDLPTWQSVGGVGNPLNASPAEQDKRAAMLYARRGGQPWVNCR